MGIRATIPPGATPLAAVDAIMALYGRESIEIAIETLIERLDEIDGDPDLEDDDPGRCDARDDDVTDWGTATIAYVSANDDENIEPSLGSIGDDGRYSQEHWAAHGGEGGLDGNHLSDREDEHDGREDDCLIQLERDL